VRRTTRRPAVVVALVLAAAAAGVLVLWRHADGLAESRARVTAEREATQAASAVAVAMTTYDHRALEDDFAWVEEDGTDSFEETFLASTRPVRELIREQRATAEGEVTDAAGTAEDEDHVTVLLFVDQVIERAGEPEPAVESTRVVMEMVRQDGRWLVDDVQLR
jgi:Mce-associated membrane protein